MKHFLPLVICFASCFCFLPFSGQAQNSDDAKEVTTTYLLQNAFVVQKPGVVLPNTSILVKNGLIKAVGTDIDVPFDAKIIELDSMYVYPAFIDACSHVGVPKPKDKDRPRVDNPGNPPLDVVGITPQQDVRSLLNDKPDGSLKDIHEIGFGYVHAVPREGMLPGQGTIMSTSNHSPEKTIIAENMSMYAQFAPARRMAPGTLIGVMSKFRDLYKNAELSLAYHEKYILNPSGMVRPDHSQELEALFPVVEKKMPVFFKAEKVRDIHRAIKLQEDLGFNLVLTEVQQAWPMMDLIKSNQIPVIMSLDLPKEIKSDEEGEEDSKSEGEEIESDSTKQADPKVEALKKRQLDAYQSFIGQYAEMVNQGITVAFTTEGVKSGDIMKNLRTIHESGLSDEEILKSLTTTPASMLQIDRMTGSIEAGKIANLFVIDQPFLNEDAKIQYILNDGKLQKNKKKKKPKKSDEKTSLFGTWTYLVDTPDGSQSGTMVIKQTDSGYQVGVDSSDEPGSFDYTEEVEVKGNNLTLSLTVSTPEGGMPVSMTLDFNGNEYEGTVTVPQMGSFPISGSKSSDPK